MIQVDLGEQRGSRPRSQVPYSGEHAHSGSGCEYLGRSARKKFGKIATPFEKLLRVHHEIIITFLTHTYPFFLSSALLLLRFFFPCLPLPLFLLLLDWLLGFLCSGSDSTPSTIPYDSVEPPATSNAGETSLTPAKPRNRHSTPPIAATEQEDWYKHFKQAQKFYNANSHLDTKDKDLSDWIAHQRGLKSWIVKITELETFHQQHGNLSKLPNNLSIWISKQRNKDKRGVLEEPQKRLLISMDIDMEGNQRTRDSGCEIISDLWIIQFNKLKRYRDTHGDCNVPYNFVDDIKLAKWVISQRQRYNLLLRPNQKPPTWVRQLEEIGFEWSPRKMKVSWKDKYRNILLEHQKLKADYEQVTDHNKRLKSLLDSKKFKTNKKISENRNPVCTQSDIDIKSAEE